MLKTDSANDRVSLDTVDKEPDGQQLSEGRAGGNALYTPNLCARLLVRQVRPLPSPNGSLSSSTCPHTYSHEASCPTPLATKARHFRSAADRGRPVTRPSIRLRLAGEARAPDSVPHTGPVHGAGQIGLGCFDGQVEVVAHQAVGMQHEMEAGDDRLQHA